MSTLRIATLNCRNTVDRWRARAPLLLDQLGDADASIVTLQELRHFFPNQGRWIAEQAGRRTGNAYWHHATWKSGVYWLWEGTAILSRLPILERGSLKLQGQNRTAGFVRVKLPDDGDSDGMLDVYNVHLATGSEELRIAQAKQIVGWMATRPGVPALVAGDFNTIPNQPSLDVFRRTMRSAHVVVHGTEPAGGTVPTPLRRQQSKPAVLDYIFVNELIDVLEAGVAFDAVSPEDPTLCASDHYGLIATISVPKAGS
jgi:endonuclease/exonuclease/phosphatase family metal-dependent hydrolase